MITAVTTCMGRREHLEVTLPHMLNAFDKVVVVDWSCPQRSGEWAFENGASVVYKTGEKRFDRCAAKNLGAAQVQTDYIAFVDADGWCFPGLGADLHSLLSHSAMVLAARNSKGLDLTDTFGFVACPTEAFRRVGGYDESFKGWGHEDSLLRGKLLLEAWLTPVRLKPDSIGAIRHSNELRQANQNEPFAHTAAQNFKKLYAYFETFGIKDWMKDPRTESITFKHV